MVQVYNVVPIERSGETAQDSESCLAVDPVNPDRLVMTAFTFDSLSGPPMTGNLAPVYVSLPGTGGAKWAAPCIIPSMAGAILPTRDITICFGSVTGALYFAYRTPPAPPLSDGIDIMRSTDPTLMSMPTTLLALPLDAADQPWVSATTPLGGLGPGQDHVVVGLDSSPRQTGPGPSALIAWSRNANALPPITFTETQLETRVADTDSSPRIAWHYSGRVYAAHYSIGDTLGTGTDGSNFGAVDVVVYRDDQFCDIPPIFTALMDTSDGNVGYLARSGIISPISTPQSLGQDRFGKDLAIAVDPTDLEGKIVYLAYGTGTSSDDYALHVCQSTDWGQHWSDDLRTIPNAKNAALAVNSRGVLGFLYQQFVATPTNGDITIPRWQTHFERTRNQFATSDSVNFLDAVLADTDATLPKAVPFPPGTYLGDFACLLSVGTKFYGSFCASNYPDRGDPNDPNRWDHFPSGVTYQRNVTWPTNTLWDETGTNAIAASIDPFFFSAYDFDQISGIGGASDFYVRDWTDSPTSGDNGDEPSTHSAFWATSDVWNQLANVPPTFNSNDQPVGGTAQSGVGSAGDNYAFARIRRNDAGDAADVTVHFLFSEFGTGSNFQDAGTAPDVSVHFNAGQTGPLITPAYQWHLDPTLSTHLCIAVEISAPGDSYTPPSLAGLAPGWPTGTDLRILMDNNKAQRNLTLPGLILPRVMKKQQPRMRADLHNLCIYAVVHNAATYPRTIALQYETPAPDIVRGVGGIGIGAIGGLGRLSVNKGPHQHSGGMLVLPAMQPGENRWIYAHLGIVTSGTAGAIPITFTEMMGTGVVNGFTIEFQFSPDSIVIPANLAFQRSVFDRLAMAFQNPYAERESEIARELLLRKTIDSHTYVSMLRQHAPIMGAAVTSLLKTSPAGDPFGLAAATSELTKAASSGQITDAAAAHAALLHKLDAFMTYLQKAQGDPADILQNVLWQANLFRFVPRLRQTGSAQDLVTRSYAFVRAYGQHKVGNADYPALIGEVLPDLRAAAMIVPDLHADVVRMATALQSGASVRQLQRAHRSFLLHLQPHVAKS